MYLEQKFVRNTQKVVNKLFHYNFTKVFSTICMKAKLFYCKYFNQIWTQKGAIPIISIINKYGNLFSLVGTRMTCFVLRLWTNTWTTFSNHNQLFNIEILKRNSYSCWEISTIHIKANSGVAQNNVGFYGPLSLRELFLKGLPRRDARSFRWVFGWVIFESKQQIARF